VNAAEALAERVIGAVAEAAGGSTTSGQNTSADIATGKSVTGKSVYRQTGGKIAGKSREHQGASIGASMLLPGRGGGWSRSGRGGCRGEGEEKGQRARASCVPRVATSFVRASSGSHMSWHTGLHMSWHTGSHMSWHTACRYTVSRYLHVSIFCTYTHTHTHRVLILLRMRPHAPTYASSYCYICARRHLVCAWLSCYRF
jgi:hypothetical protein